MNRLFVFDIDGTLVNRSYELKQEVIDAINLLLDDGDIVATCSGRSFVGSNRFLSQFKCGKKFAICSNGAAIYFDSKVLIRKLSLKYKDYLKTVKIAADREYFFPYFYYEDNLYHLKYDECIELDKVSNLNESFNVENNFEPNTEIDKIMIRDKTREKMQFFKVPLSFKLKYSAVKSSKVFLEVTNKKATKGSGVEFLRKYLSIPRKDVYVFGDSGNDVSMIKKYKNSIAMGNAIEAVKKHAKYTTKSVDDCGVAYALKDILKVI